MSQSYKALWLSVAIVAGGVLPILLYGFNAFPMTGGPDFGATAAVPGGVLGLHPMSGAEQWLAAITGFGVKPLYMLISLGLVVWLGKQRAPDLAALRWGLLLFWLGEVACAADYLFFGGHSDFWEFLHSYGMAVGFSFVAYAVIEGIDTRIIRYRAPKERCALLNLCHACVKYAEVPCKLQRLFAVLLPAMIVVAAIPLCSRLQAVAYHVNLFGTTQTSAQPMSCQLFEGRYCPLLAMALLSASWLVLLWKREDPVAPAKILFAAAVGPLSFGLMRWFLFSAFRDNLVWFDVWEEVTELLFTVAVTYVLWIFRDTLFAKEPSPSPSH